MRSLTTKALILAAGIFWAGIGLSGSGNAWLAAPRFSEFQWRRHRILAGSGAVDLLPDSRFKW